MWTYFAKDPFLSFTLNNIYLNVSIIAISVYTLCCGQLHREKSERYSVRNMTECGLNQEQLVAITMDSTCTANVKMACPLLRWTKLICFGHNLGLSISKGHSCVKENLKVCSQAVSNFFYSWKKTRDLIKFISSR